MTKMRAKMRVTDVMSFSSGGQKHDVLRFNAVSKDGPYPADGPDEDNTFARFSPSGELRLTVANPALIGKFAIGDTFYLDFTPVTSSRCDV